MHPTPSDVEALDLLLSMSCTKITEVAKQFTNARFPLLGEVAKFIANGYDITPSGTLVQYSSKAHGQVLQVHAPIKLPAATTVGHFTYLRVATVS